ncbi:hypothetical protein JHK87_019468 [Glycine soja]|nr:hypothetical protein JHK87_019468 [Glycine soja]
MGHRKLQRIAGKNLQLKGPISRVVGRTRDLVQTLLLRTGVNQVLQTRVKHLVGKKQQMVVTLLSVSCLLSDDCPS